jgi:hypothetical protein
VASAHARPVDSTSKPPPAATPNDARHATCYDPDAARPPRCRSSPRPRIALAARAEGEIAALRDTNQREVEVEALRDALADLAQRLDLATAELRELRRPRWRRWLG